MNIQNHLMALGLAGAMAIGTAVTASAGPLPIGNSALTTATAPATTEIQYRGHRGHRGIGPGLAFGLATGALVGAAVAAQPYGYYGYGPGYGPGYVYDAPVYAEPYAYEPVYPAPGYYGGYGHRYGGCTTDEGYGRRRACSAQ